MKQARNTYGRRSSPILILLGTGKGTYMRCIVGPTPKDEQILHPRRSSRATARFTDARSLSFLRRPSDSLNNTPTDTIWTFWIPG